MKISLFVFCLLYFLNSSGQFLQDVSGKPYLQNPSNEYQGSPLLFQAWVKASVTTADGKIYQNMLVNVDILQDVPIFLRDDKIYTFSAEVNEFTIADSSSKLTFKRGGLINQNLPNVLMEIISDSPVVVKRHSRSLIEVPTYGSSNKSYRYSDGKTYYAVIDNENKKITLTKQNAQKLLSKNWAAIEKYATTNNVSFKTEEGWRLLIKYYQSGL